MGADKGKPGLILGEGFHARLQAFECGDGGPYAGWSGKLTTGNIRWDIMSHLILQTIVGN